MKAKANPMQRLWMLRPAPRRLRPERSLLELMLADEAGLARLRRAIERRREEEEEIAPEDVPLPQWNGLQVVLAHWTLDPDGIMGPEEIDAMRRCGHIAQVIAGVASHLDGRPMPLLRVRFADGYVLWAWKCDLLIPGEREDENEGRAG